MNKNTWTEEEIRKLEPCREGLEFAAARNFDLARVWNECERGDWLIWLLRRTRNIDKPTAVRLAIECAKHVLPLFEKQHPNDRRPHDALAVAEEWLKEPSEKNRQKARAAYAAAADAYAADAYAADAYAAAAAAYAADAYAAAADADADAAAAYAAAAAAADAADAYAADAYAYDAYAYAAARHNERKWQADKIRELILNPFKK